MALQRPIPSPVGEDVLAACEADQIGFVPWLPLAEGDLARPFSALTRVAERKGATLAQIVIAWLLRRSPAMLPLRGTGSLAHSAGTSMRL